MVIKIADYCESWPAAFITENARLVQAIGEFLHSVEHIGSTSVPGLAAKPIIDIMPGVKHSTQLDPCVEPLQMLGYHYVAKYEAIMPFRRYLWKQSDDPQQPGIHLHIVEYGGDFWKRHLRFRDMLRSNEILRVQYEQLKRDLAPQFKDVNDYAEAKTEFIQKALQNK